MEEEHKSTEEQYKEMLVRGNELIDKANKVLGQLSKTLKVMLVVAGIVFIPFFYSFVDVQVRVKAVENNKVEKDVLVDKYATKQQIIYFQNDIYEINKSSFSLIDPLDEPLMEVRYQRALKEFNGDISRSSSN